MSIELDYMEYATDELAQAAYKGEDFSAIGGTITTVGSDKVHIFNSDGTFTPAVADNIKILVVGGGASGGARIGGDGGGGGVVYNASLAVTAKAYAIVIGPGGPAAASANVTVFVSDITAGLLTLTVPSGVNHILQKMGKSRSTTYLDINADQQFLILN